MRWRVGKKCCLTAATSQGKRKGEKKGKNPRVWKVMAMKCPCHSCQGSTYRLPAHWVVQRVRPGYLWCAGLLQRSL